MQYTFKELHKAVKRGDSLVVRLPFEPAYRDILDIDRKTKTIVLSELVTAPKQERLRVHFGTLLCSLVEDITSGVWATLFIAGSPSMCSHGHNGVCEDDIEAWFPRH